MPETLPDHIPVLTVRQPWAWALLHGKPVENRSWEMKHRGPLWLHAGARSRWDRDGETSPLVNAAWSKFIGPVSSMNRFAGTKNVTLNRDNPHIAFGAVTALLNVTGCHHGSFCWGCDPWAAMGQWHIETSLIAALPEPVPCRGMLGLWRLPDDVEKAVREQLERSCRHCSQPIKRCKHPAGSNPVCKGWRHTGYDSQPVIGHCCGGRGINPSAEPEEDDGV